MSLQQLNPLNQDHWLDIYKEFWHTRLTRCVMSLKLIAHQW